MADTDHRTSLPTSAPPTGQHPSFSFRAWSPGPAREPGRAAATQQGAEGLRRERSGGQLLFRGLRLKVGACSCDKLLYVITSPCAMPPCPAVRMFCQGTWQPGCPYPVLAMSHTHPSQEGSQPPNLLTSCFAVVHAIFTCCPACQPVQAGVDFGYVSTSVHAALARITYLGRVMNSRRAASLGGGPALTLKLLTGCRGSRIASLAKTGQVRLLPSRVLPLFWRHSTTRNPERFPEPYNVLKLTSPEAVPSQLTTPQLTATNCCSMGFGLNACTQYT
ncbi:hypothetical protein HaLaN_30313 [Haematococcus lacustris]|uniref:Uncharacterized protein n=1 Tax=Haematococcus lacustris TaxID=44745 RepID=A0A6A0AF77_HAELA|nr:hypothetical protein HaLaN_30313 [Haematococcus lacustris]